MEAALIRYAEVEIPVAAERAVWAALLDPYITEGWTEDQKWYKDPKRKVMIIKFKKFFPN